MESGERKIVGVNHGVLEEEEMPPLLKPDPELGEKQKEKLGNIRNSVITIQSKLHWMQ